MRMFQGYHYTIHALGECVHRSSSERNTEVAVHCSGRSTAQEMAQDDAAAFLASEFLQLCTDSFADTAKSFHPSGFATLHRHVATESAWCPRQLQRLSRACLRGAYAGGVL